MEKLEYVGPYISYIIQNKKMLPSVVCSYAGISYMELNNIQNGRFEAHPNTLKKICDYIGIDFISLFKKQDKYRKLLDDAFHVLTYDIMDEQKQVMKKLDGVDFEHSILFPEYLLMKIMYLGINDPLSEEYEDLLEKLSLFVNVLSSDFKGLYYVYKGIYFRERELYDKCEQFFLMADKISPFSYRELLYQHFGCLSYYQDRYVESLDYYNKAFELYEKKWNINRLLYTTCSIGITYVGMRCFELAEKQLLKTLKLGQQYKNDFVIYTCYFHLCYAHFLMRDYEGCIRYGLKMQSSNEFSPQLYVFLAYSYAKLENFGEAALWAGRREQMDPNSFCHKALLYVKKIFDRQEDDTEYLEMLYKDLPGDLKEMKILLLEDISNIYHEAGNLIEENKMLREIIRIMH